MRFVLFLLLLSPAKKEWSKVHGIGISIPATWKIVERDKQHRAFVVEGPELGPGTPRVVVSSAGPADAAPLNAKADEVAKALGKRPGFTVVARARKVVGPYAAVRFGLDLKLKGNRKGRGRVTVLLMGDRYVVLEMSAAATHFPGLVYDRIEKSLAVEWKTRKLDKQLLFDAPSSWEYRRPSGPRVLLVGPALGAGPTMVRIGDGVMPAGMLEGAKPGRKLLFLSRKRDTLVLDRERDGRKIRLLHVTADGFTATAMAPVSIWEDVAPTIETVLSSVRRPK